MDYRITNYDLRHRDAVIGLWREVFGYETARNEPSLVIDKKEEFEDGLFYVAEAEMESGAALTGTVMCGYDGHRGWIYSLAVSPEHRGNGIGGELLRHAERALADLGCVKINLQIAEGNQAVEQFYHKQGYVTEQRISMGKIIRAEG